MKTEPGEAAAPDRDDAAAPADPNAKPMPLPLCAAAGLLMGGADAIPGVSGGTIALIIGIYERFITALGVVVKAPVMVGTADGRRRLGRALRFIVPLGFGILVSYYVATKILVGKSAEPGFLRREATAPICYAFFFGLVIASIPQPFRRIREHGPTIWVAAAAGAAAAFVFTGLPYQGGTQATWMLLWGGAGAIAVMLLPGVSGSLFLVIVGQYNTVAMAFHDRRVLPLLVFAGGIALGAALFVPALRYLLERRHDLTMATLTGLMAGSLRALWPWKTGYDPKIAPMINTGPTAPYHWVALGLVLGVAVVFLLTRLERRMARHG